MLGSFLEINGWTIPVEAGSVKSTPIEIGSRSRAFDGTYRSEVRKVKQRITATTTPQKELVREAIIGIIRGDGDVWPYGVKTAAETADLYSHAGLAPNTADADGTLVPGFGADGDRVLYSDFFATAAAARPFSPFRQGHLAVDPATSNLFSADQRDCENGTTGFHAFGTGGVGSSSDHYWQQVNSIQVSAALAIDDGVETDAVDPGAGSATKTYVASFYLKFTNTGSYPNADWTCHLRDITNGASGDPVSITAVASTWVRCACKITIGAIDCRDLRLRITADATGSQCVIDGLQLEELDYPTAWVDGDRASADELSYPLTYVNGPLCDFSVGMWFFGPDTTDFPSHGNDAYLWSLYSATGVAGASLLREGGGDTVTFRTIDADGTQRDLETTGFTPDWENWIFVGCSFRMNPETGGYEKRLFIGSDPGDGEQTFTDDTSQIVIPDDGSSYSFYVGNQDGANQWIGTIGETIFYPFAIDDAALHFWFSVYEILGGFGFGDGAGSPLPQHPRKYLTGDLGTKYDSVAQILAATKPPTYEGVINEVQFLRGNIGGAKSNLARVSFTLEEV